MNLDVLIQAGPVIILHMVAALLALALGLAMMVRKKGTPSHKLIGKLFVGLMLTVAISAIFIREINNGSFSWIHLFVPLTLVVSVLGVLAIRRGEVARHKRHMIGLFFGALLIPGAFSLLPGRLIWRTLFG